MATSPSERDFDIVVIGAGPAGLAAATTAAQAGATVALVDAGSRPGGQYWRQPTGPGIDPSEVGYLHHDLKSYRHLVAVLESPPTTYLPEHHVWALVRSENEFVVHALDHSGSKPRSREVAGRRLVLATGAYDRQIPFPGWDLPGVMAAGGVQALLKGQHVKAGQRVVVAGTGPFLLPVATGLAAAGADVLGVHEANSPRRWLGEGRAVLGSMSKLGEGVSYASSLVRHRVPVRTRSLVVAAHGEDRLEAVTTARCDTRGRVVAGTEERVAADCLAVGWGFTPQLELPLSLGCGTRVDTDGSLVCVVDDSQQSTVSGVFVAGESCGIGGAALALLEGAIAGRSAAGSGQSDRRPRRQRASLRRFADAMHRAHPVPASWTERLDDETVVCRCEEVTCGTLRRVVFEDLGAGDARSAKLIARPGMGWCQGRVCGYATACLMAAWSGTPYSPTSLARRPVAAPITLGLLAADASPRGRSSDSGAPAGPRPGPAVLR